MPRTKGSKNRITASTDFDAQIAKLQKDKRHLKYAVYLLCHQENR